jgi:hypothetical protein
LGNLGVARILSSGFSQFSEADGLESKTVVSVFEDHDGKLYAVTGFSHTFNQFDGERFTRIRPRVPASLRDFGWGENAVALQDRRGEWWIATGPGSPKPWICREPLPAPCTVGVTACRMTA